MAPATRGGLMSVKHDLEGKIDGLDGRTDRVAADLKAEITAVKADLKGVRADLEVGLKDVQVGLARIAWTAVATLGAVGILLRFFWCQVDRQGMRWMI